MEEIWKPIPGYEGVYVCSNFGKVKSIAREIKVNYNKYYTAKGFREKQLGSINKRTGYIHVRLYDLSGAKSFCVHQLVAMTFLGYKKTIRKICINHIDGNRNNNHVDNLEVVSMAYNVQDGFKRGRIPPRKGSVGVKYKKCKI